MEPRRSLDALAIGLWEELVDYCNIQMRALRDLGFIFGLIFGFCHGGHGVEELVCCNGYRDPRLGKLLLYADDCGGLETAASWS